MYVSVIIRINETYWNAVNEEVEWLVVAAALEKFSSFTRKARIIKRDRIQHGF